MTERASVRGPLGSASGGESAEARASRSRKIVVAGLDAGAVGSVPAIVRTQAELLSLHFDVTLIARSISGESKRLRAIRVPSPSFRSLRRFGHVVREYVASRRIAQALLETGRVRGIEAAIFHSHTLAALAARSCAEAGIRTILVAHADIRKRPKGAYDPLLTRLYQWSNPAAYRRVDRVVALCREFGDLARLDATSPASVREIPCPVAGPWPVAARRASIPPGADVRIGFVGRLAIEKGLPTLIEAFAEFRYWRPASRLGLAGEGSMRRELEERVARANLEESVDFLGWRSEGSLEAFYRQIDLLCLPSISENQGVAAQEALLRGIPVVATRVGGLADSIRPGLDGELCEPASASSLTQALRRCVARLETEGYVVPDPEWMKPYSPEGHRGAIERLIEELVE